MGEETQNKVLCQIYINFERRKTEGDDFAKHVERHLEHNKNEDKPIEN